MSEQPAVDSSQPRLIHVAAQPDHLASLARGRPISAIAELVWNALDADADQVQIKVQDNELGSPELIEVTDNGLGIDPSDAERAFGNLGGSRKRDRPYSDLTNKKMHGRDGKGRFKAFALGGKVDWDTVYLTDDGVALNYVIKGNANRLQDFEIGQVKPAEAGSPRGTRVRISEIGEPLGVLSSDGAGDRQLAELFALYLRNYPATRIVFRGQRIDPRSVQKGHQSFPLATFMTDEGIEVGGYVDIVEWSFAKKERRICLCDSEGFTLHEVEAGVRPGTEFNFTAYIRSDYISHLHNENLLALEELNNDLRRLIEDARSRLRSYFRKRKAESASELVQQWKAEGVYPFSGDADNAVETATREVFDICALNVHQYLESFREGRSKDREFTLRMLKVALDENPESLKRVLSEVLDLPTEKQNELADLLQFTTLSSIIEASQLVTERLRFLSGLQELLFRSESKIALRERTQLHRMLESETWIFGEEYLLTSSDENLNTVLAKYIKKLRPKSKAKAAPVIRDDGRQAVIDLMLAREVAAYAHTRREFLVVELKRPNQKVDLTVQNQILSYAMAVASDERFSAKDTHWTFLAVSNEMTPEAARTVNQTGKPYGFFHEEDNLRVGLATWAQVLNACRARLEAFRTKLDYAATVDQGIALLHSKYAKFLPSNFAPDESEG